MIGTPLPNLLVEQLSLLTRYYKVRKLRLVPSVLAEYNHLWLFDNPLDPWGSRRRITWEQLESMVAAVEQQRKQPESVMITAEKEKRA